MAERNYTLGRGKLFFAQFLAGTKTIDKGERYIGNTPAFGLNVESEILDHFDSDSGVRIKDDAALLQLIRSGQFTTDDIDIKNMSLFLLGSDSTQVQGSATGVVFPSTVLHRDMWYQLGVTTANPSGVREVSTVVLTKTAGSVALVQNTDYELDAALGRFRILPTSSVITANGDACTGTFNVAAKSRVQVITAANTVLEGAMRFIANNPKGEKRDFFMPYVRLTPNGEFSIKSDEWQQLSFNVEILKRDDSTESIYCDGRAYTP